MANQDGAGEGRASIMAGVSRVGWVFVAMLAYSAALEWGYSTIIQPAFAYGGNLYEPSGWGMRALSWVLISICACFLPRRISRPSAGILWILFVVAIAPSVLMSSYLGIVAEESLIWLNLGFAGGYILLCLVTRRSDAAPALMPRPSRVSFWIVLAGFSAFVYLYMAFTAGLKLEFLAIMEVYDTREEYSQVLQTAGMLGYLVSTQANVVNPLIVARGLVSRSPLIIMAGVFGQLLLYSGTGFKTILFSIPAILAFALLFRGKGAPRGILIVWGAVGVVLVSALLDAIQGSIIWSSLFARRFLFTPARLSGLYYEFFSNNGFDLLSHSVLSSWLESPHLYGPARMISLWFKGHTGTAMNANFFADGYAQFGWFGVVGVAVALGIYLRVLDRASVGLPVVVASLTALMPAITLSNTSFHTSILSHGLLVLVIVLMVAPFSGWRPADGVAESGTSRVEVRDGVSTPGQD